MAFLDNVKKIAKKNHDFRHVLFTGPHSQLVVMSLDPGDEIGEETHEKIDQFFYVMDGKGLLVLDGRPKPIEEHDGIVVPAGTRHNVKNTGRGELKLITIYSPPAHADGTIHKTREEARTLVTA